jgi:PAS domain S-box-containing protein
MDRRHQQGHEELPTAVTSGRKWLGRLCAVVTFLAIALSTQAGTLFAQTPPPAKHVLLLNSFTERIAFDSVESVKSAVRSRVPGPVDFYVEFIEGFRLDDPAYENALVESFRNAYSKEKIDLVMVAARPALEFAVKHRDELFSGSPIVFMEMSSTRLPKKMWPGVTGVTATLDVHATVDLALRLHPQTTTVAIITNDSAFEKYWLAAVHNDLVQRSPKLNEVDLIALSPEKLVEQAMALPLHSVVLFQEAPQETQQPVIGPYEALASIAQRLPTYTIFPVICLGRGCIGGASWDNQEQTSLAAEMAGRVLSGEKPENIPIVSGKPEQVRVDWRELQYWHIPESALPPGSIVVNREPTLWERDRGYIIAAVVLIIVQTLSIIGLLLQRARKRKAEAVLSESEGRFRTVSDTAPVMIWMSNTEKLCTYFNKPWLDFTGRSFESELGDGWADGVHPEDLPACLETYTRRFDRREPFRMEYRLRRYDGQYRWILDIGVPRFGANRSFAGFIGSAVDVTDQKVAQDALANVSGRLIKAQENERTRIARDLHDDICQRLALLSMELEQANRNGAPPSTKKKLETIRQHCSEIAGDVQALSHQLHSSKLDYLGTVAAIRALCKEFATQHQADVQFNAEDIPSELPKEVSLCFFRVTQEALQNAIKYSGTRQVAVSMRGVADGVELIVRDAGSGFDVEEAKRQSGLGLVSMQERVNLLHGRFRIESRPGAGTRIIALVPVAVVNSLASDKSTKAAGSEGAA